MPVGDSITVGYPWNKGGYRAPLLAALHAEGWKGSFAGTQGVNEQVSGRCTAYCGWNVERLSQVAPAAAAVYHPEIILLLAGINDCHPEDAPAPITINHICSLVAAMHASDPKAVIYVASLTPCTGSNERLSLAKAARINALLPSAVSRYSHMRYVDMYHASKLKPCDLPDGLHPNVRRYGMIAAAWLHALHT